MGFRQVTVVGSGIIGASIAWHLTEAGAKVTVISNARGGVATPRSFAWINASWGNSESYFRFRIRAMEEWNRLAAAVPAIPYLACGGLCWDLPPEKLKAYAEEHRSWGYGIRAVSRDEIAGLEPHLAGLPDFALHAANEGAADPLATAEALIADVRSKGAEILTGIDVRSLIMDGNRIRGLVTSDGDHIADTIVVAAGAGTAALAATAGIDVAIESPPGLLVHSRPTGKVLNGLVIGEKAHIRQTAEGRIVAGSDFGGTDPGSDPDKAAEELFATVQTMLPDAGLELDFYTVGHRPTPKDGLPIIGPVGRDGLYAAVMHSGVTLAPLVGRLVAAEVLGEPQPEMLAPYRLSRFG
ncbi:glycine/D-amino acid oxidase-like deaminating enzyme [Pararhizobium capsulatum DSM 1112]|uniref:Glycine/D-amino acid oxidase-like deaminating enzyme n=1 Tax=Pararhizobium capsulatum DSM 1112 TaxID=1121113 RepID=A0ABU0BV62_9HYPH|nr:FAD-binding oxidoreductase [Pararhizobium capsulatum]MDQ0321872.1 glycine/D-amino acid oxidase-like deaminating enzyme [Pararhizobium capsulatum DSM 1112]